MERFKSWKRGQGGNLKYKQRRTVNICSISTPKITPNPDIRLKSNNTTKHRIYHAPNSPQWQSPTPLAN